MRRSSERASENHGAFRISRPAAARRIAKAFHQSTAHGLLHLATAELQTGLSGDFAFARDFGRDYLTRLCHTPEQEGGMAPEALAVPTEDRLAAVALAAPPMPGAEYLNAEALARWWTELDELVRQEAAGCRAG